MGVEWVTGEDTNQSLGESITQVRLDIRELMTEVRSLKSLGEKVEEIRERMIKAEDSARAAHRRLDTHDKIIFWFGTTTIGAMVIGIITFFMKGGAA